MLIPDSAGADQASTDVSGNVAYSLSSSMNFFSGASVVDDAAVETSVSLHTSSPPSCAHHTAVPPHVFLDLKPREFIIIHSVEGII